MKTLTVEYSKNISFKDASGKTVFIEISIEDGTLSMSGNMAGSAGQIYNSIKPADDGQRELIELWKTFHLNDIHAGTVDQENALKSEDFEKFSANYSAVHAEAKKIEKVAQMSLEEYVTFIDAWKLRDSQNKTVRSYPIACKDDLEHIQKMFAAKHTHGSLFERLRDKLYMGEQKYPFKDVNFQVLGDVPLHEILSGSSPSHYTAACAYLKTKGLLVASNNGQPYTYGSAWLKRELPSNIIERIETLCNEIGAEEFTGSSYEKQANDLLAGMGVKFAAVYKDHAKYFDDDQESRDIYSCTFKRQGKQFSIRFGQSIANQGTPPTAYDVLACLTKNDPGDLYNFCSEMGYDQDSRKAEKIYKAVCAEWKKVDGFFSDTELDQLQEIG